MEEVVEEEGDAISTTVDDEFEYPRCSSPGLASNSNPAAPAPPPPPVERIAAVGLEIVVIVAGAEYPSSAGSRCVPIS